MAEFIPITIESQEQFDGMVKDRLNRQSEKHAKEMDALKSQLTEFEAIKEKESGYITRIEELTSQLEEVNNKVSGYDSMIAAKDAEISKYKIDAVKNTVLNEMGLPLDAINFLTGTDEETIRANAESLKTLVGSGQRVAPLANYNDNATDSKTEALKTMLNNLSN